MWMDEWAPWWRHTPRLGPNLWSFWLLILGRFCVNTFDWMKMIIVLLSFLTLSMDVQNNSLLTCNNILAFGFKLFSRVLFPSSVYQKFQGILGQSWKDTASCTFRLMSALLRETCRGYWFIAFYKERKTERQKERDIEREIDRERGCWNFSVKYIHSLYNSNRWLRCLLCVSTVN